MFGAAFTAGVGVGFCNDSPPAVLPRWGGVLMAWPPQSTLSLSHRVTSMLRYTQESHVLLCKHRHTVTLKINL